MKKSFGPEIVVYPTPVFIVGTYDDSGRPNIMNVAWGGVCCSRPPCLAISVREATYTYGNLVRTQAFTVNIPSASQVREADYAGIYSGRDEDKFAALGLTPVKAEFVNAPCVQEFPLVIECNVIQTVEIGLHTQFIGRIMDVKIEESILDAEGIPDVQALAPFSFSPLDRMYYRLGEPLAQAFVVGKKNG